MPDEINSTTQANKQITQSNLVNSTDANYFGQHQQIGSRGDAMKPTSYGPVIRTPNQKSTNNLANQVNQGHGQGPPPAPIYQPAKPQPPPLSNNNYYNPQTNPYGLPQPQQQNFNMSNAVNSIVDTWEADLAKHVKGRRASGQMDRCKNLFKCNFKQIIFNWKWGLNKIK